MSDGGIWTFFSSGEGQALVALAATSAMLPYLRTLGRRLTERWVRRRSAARSAAKKTRDRVATRVASGGLGLPAERLCQHIREHGWIPLQVKPAKTRRLRASRALRRYLLTMDTQPKGGFAITQWHYRPLVATDETDGSSYQAAFELDVEVHAKENRRHLSRSLRAVPQSSSSTRLVVLASAHDMLNDDATVRCLVVDALVTEYADQPCGRLTLRQYSPLLDGSPTVYSRVRRLVPDNAIWLVVPVTTCREPTSLWGHLEERFALADAMPDEPAGEHLSDSSIEQEMRRRLKRHRRVRFAIWFILSFGASGFLLLRQTTIRYAMPRGAGNWDLAVYVLNSGLILLLSLGIAAYLWIAAYAIVDLCWESIIGLWWCRREAQTRTADKAAFLSRHGDGPRWNGGTTKCRLFLGLAARGFEPAPPRKPR
ncbi:hypothetical protein [Candidatus Poriferisodalis sp.]|uniref:hypothetical protein n=1 Tax=Candidatus Poriferisodalis sp. TaxID=3101277 RepID=UPI003B02C371